MKIAYRAITKESQPVKGEMDAKGIKEAIAYLREKGFIPIDVSEKKSLSLATYLPFLNKSTDTDLVFFTRQLASMLASGLTLMQALTIIKDQIKSSSMSTTVNEVVLDIQEGRSFSGALEKHAEVFSPIYISLIKAAEASGLLDKVLIRLADNLEKQAKLKSTIKSALTYPMIVITGMMIVMTVMMIFVIPQLTVLYDNLDIELPLPTQIVIGLSNLFVNFWPVMIGLAVFGFYMFHRWKRTDSGTLIFDDLVLRLPVFGKLIKESILTEFTRTFGLLVGTGSLVVDSLSKSADTAGNVHYKTAILGVSKRVEKGVTIGDAMSAYPKLFPQILVEMVRIGEQTGRVDESLTKVSEYFEREVEETVKNLTTAMEPFIMVVLGVGVAFLIISIITPIYNLINAIQ
jgi:type IV pilus assembly protein PilC